MTEPVESMTSPKPRVAFHTLGCKLNFSESSYLSGLLGQNGYERVEFGQEADVYVVNTCSVTGAAEKKCRNLISRTTRRAPEALIVVTGCYAQLGAETISKMEGVDLVLGKDQKFDLLHYLKDIKKRKTPEVHTCTDDRPSRFFPSWSSGDRTRSFLKVQDGCDYACSYCTIPLARGQSRNAPIDEIVAQAREIASLGIREIVLTGVNIGDFGRSTGDDFFGLIRQLDLVEGIGRFRISSIEPNLLSEAMIEWVAGSSRFVPHFHIPLQSGSNKILGLMRRRYNRELFQQKIETIRRIIPLAGIGVDVIVGFPGETGSDFEDAVQFIESLDVTYLHVFSYSARPNTPAADMPGQVGHAEKEARSQRLHLVSEKKHQAFFDKNIGEKVWVLFENQLPSGVMTGFSGNYIRVEVEGAGDAQNQIRQVTLHGITPHGTMTRRLS